MFFVRGAQITRIALPVASLVNQSQMVTNELIGHYLDTGTGDFFNTKIGRAHV